MWLPPDPILAAGPNPQTDPDAAENREAIAISPGDLTISTKPTVGPAGPGTEYWLP